MDHQCSGDGIRSGYTQWGLDDFLGNLESKKDIRSDISFGCGLNLIWVRVNPFSIMGLPGDIAGEGRVAEPSQQPARTTLPLRWFL